MDQTKPKKSLTIIETIMERGKTSSGTLPRGGIYTQTPSPVAKLHQMETKKKEQKRKYIGKYSQFFEKMNPNSPVDIYVISGENSSFYFVEAITRQGITYFVEIPSCDDGQCSVPGISTYREISMELTEPERMLAFSILDNLSTGFGVISEEQDKMVKYFLPGQESISCSIYMKENSAEMRRRRGEKNFILLEEMMILETFYGENEVDENKVRELEIMIEKMNKEMKLATIYARLKETETHIENIIASTKEKFKNVEEHHSLSSLNILSEELLDKIRRFNGFLNHEDEITSFDDRKKSRQLDPFMKHDDEEY